MRNFRSINSATTKDMVRPNIWHRFARTALARSTGDLLLQWRRLISRLRSQFRRRAPLAPHLRLGKRGEAAAERFLKKASFKILYRNFKARSGGEIDLGCRDRKEQGLVFVEVKTRRNEVFGTPSEAVTWRKRRRIILSPQERLRPLTLSAGTF